MNLSSVLGVFLAIVMIGASIWETGMDPLFFVNFHGVVIVVGGTFCAAAISYDLKKIFALFKVFVLRVLGKNKVDYNENISMLLELNKKVAVNSSGVKEMLPQIKHPFLKEGAALVADGVLSEEEVRDVLEQRIKTTKERFMLEAKMFKGIGRFPPAFGLLATTLGMIAVLQILGKEGAESMIGPAMSIGLVGTLYGISIANLIFLPIAESLLQKTEEEIALRRMILEGVVMLKKQVNAMSMRESLNSFVAPGERVNRKAA